MNYKLDMLIILHFVDIYNLRGHCRKALIANHSYSTVLLHQILTGLFLDHLTILISLNTLNDMDLGVMLSVV